MRTLIAGIRRCNRAVTAVEYALICSCIVLAIMTGVHALGSSTGNTWGRISARVVAAF